MKNIHKYWRLILCLWLFILGLFCQAMAQTTNQTNLPGMPPIAQEATTPSAWYDFMTEPGTNYVAFAYGAHSDGEKAWGGGIGLSYQLEIAGGVIQPWGRFERLGGNLYQAFGGVTFQAPRSIAGKWRIQPIVPVGISSRVTGNNTFQPIFVTGFGLYFRVYGKLGLIADVETWTGGGYKWDRQERGGLTYSF